MKLLFCLLFSLLLLSCAAQENVGQKELVFRSVNVVPMDREVVLNDQTVVVQNGRIKAIGAAGKVAYSNNALVIDGSGKYLMPGLAEMHAHVPPIDDIEPMKEVLLLFAVNGVTTIRGMLGHPRHLELRSKLQKGEILGPRFYTSGPSFNGQTVKSPAAADSMVRQQKRAGYDFLKIHPGILKENFAALAKTAKEVQIAFAGHVPYNVGIWRALDAGILTIDHLDGMVEALVPGIENISEQENGLFGMFSATKADISRIPALMAALKKSNTWVVPTQALAERWFSPSRTTEQLSGEPEMKYMDPKTVANWANTKNSLMKHPAYQADAINRYIELRRRLIKECQQNGIGLLLGSDAPQVFDVPGFSVHHELKYLVDAGLTPYQALQTGTANVGTFLKRQDQGVIKTGAVADLLLLSDNPLANIENTRKIEGVLMGNQWLSRQSIETILGRLEKK